MGIATTALAARNISQAAADYTPTYGGGSYTQRELTLGRTITEVAIMVTVIMAIMVGVLVVATGVASLPAALVVGGIASLVSIVMYGRDVTVVKR